MSTKAPIKIVILAGGHGPHSLLHAIKEAAEKNYYGFAPIVAQRGLQITVGTGSHDSGGSTGILRDAYPMLVPPGDARQALVGLARNQIWGDLFAYRFPKQGGLQVQLAGTNMVDLLYQALKALKLGDLSLLRRCSQHAGAAATYKFLIHYSFPVATGRPVYDLGGHNLGNLLIKALQDRHQGDFIKALQDAAVLVESIGNVFTTTVVPTHISSLLEDGTHVYGEAALDLRGEQHSIGAGPLSPIKKLSLLPPAPHICLQLVNALKEADLIIVGPGDFYTSWLPTILVPQIRDELLAASHKVAVVVNLGTKHGETDAYAASTFMQKIYQHMGVRSNFNKFGRAIVNDPVCINSETLVKLSNESSEPVQIDGALMNMVQQVQMERLLLPGEHRYDGDVLLRAVLRYV